MTCYHGKHHMLMHVMHIFHAPCQFHPINHRQKLTTLFSTLHLSGVGVIYTWGQRSYTQVRGHTWEGTPDQTSYDTPKKIKGGQAWSLIYICSTLTCVNIHISYWTHKYSFMSPNNHDFSVCPAFTFLMNSKYLASCAGTQLSCVVLEDMSHERWPISNQVVSKLESASPTSGEPWWHHKAQVTMATSQEAPHLREQPLIICEGYFIDPWDWQ